MRFSLILSITLLLFVLHGSSGTPTAGKEERINVRMEQNTTLHIFIRPKEKGQIAKVHMCPTAFDGGANQQFQQTVAKCVAYTNDKWFDFFEVDDAKAGDYVLKWRPADTEVSFIYAFEEDTVLDEGIRTLYIRADTKLPNFEESYHFRSPIGWISDPSGFSRAADGRFHLFYEHYPHGIHWHSMYWGHATSTDLINWVHLPIFMIPPNRQYLGSEYGHFTGSAVNLSDGEMGIFWTERIMNVVRSKYTEVEVPFSEFQHFAKTKGTFKVDWATQKTIIDTIPKEENPLGISMRDPMVFLGPEGYYYMIIGEERKDLSGGVVLLYKNKHKKVDLLNRDWVYQGILHEDGRDGLKMAECAMLVALGDPTKKDSLWVLSYLSDRGQAPALGKDKEGRERMNPLIVGVFDGAKFTPKFEEQHIDFTGGAIAYQGFHDLRSKRSFTIGWLAHIGWASDFTKDPEVNGRCGLTSLTLPKEFVISEDQTHLMVRPLPELETLRANADAPQILQNGDIVGLKKSMAELCFELQWDNSRAETFELELRLAASTRMNDEKLNFIVNAGGIEIKRSWLKTDAKKLVVYSAMPTKVHVFVDLDSVEFFADNGRWTGTIRIPDGGVGSRVETVEVKSAPRKMTAANLWYLDYRVHKSANVYGSEASPSSSASRADVGTSAARN